MEVDGKSNYMNVIQMHEFLIFMYNRDYINHPLNKSPSKQTYTFGKTQRFKDIGKEGAQRLQNRENAFEKRKGWQSADQRSNAHSWQPTVSKEPPTFKEERNIRGEKSRERSKSSPSKEKGFLKEEIQEDDRKYGKNKGTDKRQYNRVKTQQGKLFQRRPPKPFKQQEKHPVIYRKNGGSVKAKQCDNTNGTSNLCDNRSQNAYGLREKPKQYSKNQPGYSFGKSPRRTIENKQKDKVSPGAYDTYSEFGTHYKRY